MCVHLVKKTDSGATVMAYEEPTRQLAQAYFSKEPSAHRSGRMPFTEVRKHQEIDRLTGKAFNGSYVEEHRLSPQSSSEIQSFYFDERSEKSRHDWKSHKENRRNARDNDRRNRCKASGQHPYLN